jgi:hypothetical protein
VSAALRPVASLAPGDVERAVPWIVREATLAEIMNTLTTGTLLCAFAVALGATTTVIGVIAGIAPACQLLQLAATALIERTRRRKAVAVIAAAVGRALWLTVALVALLPAGPTRMVLLCAVLAVRAGTNAYYLCANNSWMRDLLPDRTMGEFYSRRMRASYAAGLVTGIAGGLVVDAATGARLFGGALGAYAVLFAAATVAGELGTLALVRVPEPRLPERPREPLHGRLLAPIRDANFRRFLGYFGLWNFTTAMAQPLFVVVMLRRLGYSVLVAVLLEAAGKLAHLATLGVWGRLVDRHSSRSVVAAAQPLYWVSLLLWPLAGALGAHSAITPALIGGIYVINRVAAAGIAIGNNTLAMQLAPRGGATAYFAVRGLVANPVSFVAPVLGGLLVDAGARVPFLAGGRNLDVVLLLAALVGILSAVALRGVVQAGSTPPRAVAADFINRVRACLRRRDGATAALGGARALKGPP